MNRYIEGSNFHSFLLLIHGFTALFILLCSSIFDIFSFFSSLISIASFSFSSSFSPSSLLLMTAAVSKKNRNSGKRSILFVSFFDAPRLIEQTKVDPEDRHEGKNKHGHFRGDLLADGVFCIFLSVYCFCRSRTPRVSTRAMEFSMPGSTVSFTGTLMSNLSG